MKIAVISPKNKTVFNFRGDLIKDMIAHGNEVIVTGPNEDFMEEIHSLGISKFTVVPLVKDNTSVLGDLKYCRRLYHYLKAEKPDVVFAYTIKPVVYGSIAARFAGVKRVTPMVTGLGRVYTSDSLKTKAIRFITKILYKFAFSHCQKVIFQNSDDIEQFVKAKYLPAEKAVKVDGSGVNMQRFSRTSIPEQPAFLMTGRIIKEKGVLDYCNAAREVKKIYPQAKFTLLGGFDTSIGALKKEDIEPFIADNSIVFPGEVKDPVEFYHQASVFVLPTYYREGLPRTILEAMACGRPIITTDWPGCRDAVEDGENGFLVQPQSPQEIAEKMKLLIEDKDLLETMAQKAYETCKKTYEVSIINKKMKAVIGY